MNTPGSYSCSCNSGFQGDGVSCSDCNECGGECGGNACSTNALCTNTVGSYSCSCNSGYQGSGLVCADCNECSGECGGNACSTTALCTNTAGSYTCACNAGYQGSGFTCTDCNECAGQCGGSNCAQSGSSCANTVGSYTCACTSGFTGNGLVCTPITFCNAETTTSTSWPQTDVGSDGIGTCQPNYVVFDGIFPSQSSNPGRPCLSGAGTPPHWGAQNNITCERKTSPPPPILSTLVHD